jgi:hypothetical protein
MFGEIITIIISLTTVSALHTLCRFEKEKPITVITNLQKYPRPILHPGFLFSPTDDEIKLPFKSTFISTRVDRFFLEQQIKIEDIYQNGHKNAKMAIKMPKWQLNIPRKN